MRNLMNDRASANIIDSVLKAIEEHEGRHYRPYLDGESMLILIQQIGDYIPLNVDALEEQQYTKPYMAFWGDGYDGAPVLEEKNLEEFTQDEGYEAREIKRIKALQVNELLDLTDDLGNVHLIKRLW